MNNLEVVVTFFEVIRGVVSRHADVHGDRVGVEGDSAGGDANLASADNANTEVRFGP